MTDFPDPDKLSFGGVPDFPPPIDTWDGQPLALSGELLVAACEALTTFVKEYQKVPEPDVSNHDREKLVQAHALVDRALDLLA